MNTLFLLLAKYDTTRLNMEQIADFMNISVATVQNRIYTKSMPFAVYKEGSNHFADLNDVAAYHDGKRREAVDARAAIERSLR